jgi:hypothetical protein
MNDEWLWDSADIPDNWSLGRRIKHKYIIEDMATADPQVHPDAFMYDKDREPEGCSISIVEVNHSAGRRTSDCVPDWSTHSLGIVFVHEVRNDATAGVVSKPTIDDPGHGCIRVRDHRDKPKRREQWLPLQAKLAEQVRLHGSPESADAFQASCCPHRRRRIFHAIRIALNRWARRARRYLPR